MHTKKNGKKGAEKQSFREGLQSVLACEIADEKLREELAGMGLAPTYLNQILRAMADRAARGEMDAARYLRDIAAEKKGGGEEARPGWDGDLTALSDEELRLLVAAADGPKKGARGNG